MKFFHHKKLSAQGLVEYGVLIAAIALITIIGLSLSGATVESVLFGLCEALGSENCVAPPATEAAQPTEVLGATLTPTVTPTPTPTLSEPDPTRVVFLTPTPTAVGPAGLTVSVVDDLSGSPVRGVWMQITTPAGSYVTEATTGASGESNFALKDGSYNILVYSGQWWQAASVDLKGSQKVTVRMKTLTVNVVDDATGAAVNNVWMVIQNGDGGYVKEGTTGANGRLDFSLVNGNYKVQVHTGQWWQAAEVTLTGSQSITVRVKSLTVNVLNASGAPARGIWTVIQNASGGYVKEGTTGSNGRLDFSLVNGRYKVLVYTGQWWQAAEVDMSSSQTVTVKLKELRVKVVLNDSNNDEGNGPAVGIWVVIYNKSGGYVTEGTTNDKGTVSFSVVNGDYIIATYYNREWQRDGPFSVTNSKEYVIHRKKAKSD